MDLTISTSQEYKMILNGLKEGFQVDDSVKDKFEYSETDTSITYSFSDIDPTKDKVLFKEVKKNDTDTGYNFGQTQETPDSGFIDPKNIDFKKEFKFPYYEFTYNMKIAPESDQGSKKIETLSADDYILDEANILDQQSKNQIIQTINDVYRNDSVEIIVVTKKQMTSMVYYLSYKPDFIHNFDFKNQNQQSVMIFVSTNEDGICEVESNILDIKLSPKIRTLNTNFSNNCKTDYSGQIKNVVSELDTFFKTNDLEYSDHLADQMAEQIGDLFKIGYTVEVFGKITETNGMKMGDNKVKFDINPSKEGEYTIVFKEFFLATILGDSYWIYLSILGLLVIGGIGFLVFSKIKAGQKSRPLQVPLAVNPQLLDYVKRARSNGMTDAKIKSNLSQAGWSAKDIDLALKSK